MGARGRADRRLAREPLLQRPEAHRRLRGDPLLTAPDASPAAALLGDEPAIKSWERFFKNYLRVQINEAALAWPEKRSLVVDYYDVDKHDRSLAEALLSHPYTTLAQAQEALKSVDMPIDPRPQLHVRVSVQDHSSEARRFLPPGGGAPIPPGSAHLGKLVTLHGRVARVGRKKPRLCDAVFQCGRCGAFIKEPQEEHLVLKEPLECYEEQGGCGRDSSFKIIVTETRGMASKFIDAQPFELEEVFDEVRPGMVAADIRVWLEDDLCDTVLPGQIVYVTGVLRCNVQREKGVKSTLFDFFVEANHVEAEESDALAIEEMTPEETQLKDALLAEPDKLRHRLVRAFCPKIRGRLHDVAKLVLMLAQVEGLKIANGRSTIHALFAGDSSTGKTEIARWFTEHIARRVCHVDGSRASVPGLLVGMDTQNKVDGRPTVAPGAGVLASGGWLCIDEAHLSDPKVIESLRELMEQGTVSIALIGINAHMRVRTNVLLVMNPPDGYISPHEPPITQLGLSPAILSRFDAIFIFTDTPDKVHDTLVMGSIIDSRYEGLDEDAAPLVATETTSPDAQAEADVVARITPMFLKKFLFEAREHTLRVPREARVALRDAGVALRHPIAKRKTDGAPQDVKFRQADTITRFAEAHAKLHRRAAMTVGDVEFAVGLVTMLWGGVLGDSRDMSILEAGETRENLTLLADLTKLIREMGAGADMPPTIDDLHRELRNVPLDKLTRLVKKLHDDGRVFLMHNGRVKAV